MNNNITEGLCSFEVSDLLKDKGFDCLCDYTYEGSVLARNFRPKTNSGDWTETCAPTHALAIKWIRKNFKVHIWLENNAFGYYWATNNASELPWEGDHRARQGSRDTTLISNYPEKEYKEPEDAIEAALLYTLKNLI